MISDEIMKNQLNNTLQKTDLSIGEKYQGKVRDNYFVDDKIIMITSDRISAFDHVLGTIPFKGQVLNQISLFWFNMTRDIVKNHLIESPDPNVMVTKKCKKIPIEMVVRGYLTGSLWRAYEKGERILYGIKFNQGLKKQQKFGMPIVTPSTKEEYGKHDMPITQKEIIEKGILPREQYEKIEEAAVKLFERGTKIAADNNLILVDTKYEFGLDENDEIVLIDEIHTPDSSRFWVKDKYKDLFNQGRDQERLDKEHLRKWLMAKGFSGEGTPPKLDDDIRMQVAMMYIDLYQRITGQEFKPEAGNVLERIKENLSEYM
ncbi:phosphoribosylaminoimidazolesuccinocarboxamide synthase [Candidatus Woesearchaeota archaeon]|nr:phosphoribosylaminoimidazolesuccinocarboxamide synthase [Candidatus Woesearchaeota archaeon]